MPKTENDEIVALEVNPNLAENLAAVRGCDRREALIYVGADDQVYMDAPALERFLKRVAPGIPITRKAAVMALILCLHELERITRDG